ncbi:MAG: chemotaxis protein CheD [Candidatus Latescibacterota bacterium]|jgi:chemotaxis protein CheD
MNPMILEEQKKVSHTVGISDMKVTNDPNTKIVTHALGSCLGVTIYDPVVGVGGMIHIQLPLSTIDVQKGIDRPCMFVDTGIPLLFEEAYRLGAVKSRIHLKVAGGAQFLDIGGKFRIGERNFAILRKMLWKNSVLIEGQDVGGTISRTLFLDIATGEVTIRSGNETWVL